MICDDPWFSLIRQGVKPVEGRKNSPKYQHIRPGDTIQFINGEDNFLARVIEIKSYISLEAYLQDVTVEKALPGVKELEEATKIYQQWSTPEEIQTHGFLGIFVEPISLN
jgi:ASC-1-like (ASCH) protein